MQGPGDISCGGLEVLLALVPAGTLSGLNERMVGRANALQEQVMASEECAILLQEVHRNGKHPAKDMGKAESQLQEHNPPCEI